MESNEVIIQTIDLKKVYGEGDAEVDALKGINITIRQANLSPSWVPAVPAKVH